MGNAEAEQRLKDLEARATIAAAFGASLVVLAGASFAGLLPSQMRAIAAGLGLVGFIAAWRFHVEARVVGVGLTEVEVERERAEFDRRVRVPIAPIGQIDATRIGVDAAAQMIVPGGAFPMYVPRDVDGQLHAAITAALDGSGRAIVVAVGPSKVGKSRSLFEALKRCGEDRELELIAPRDADALRSLLTPGQLPRMRMPHRVLWLDDLEPYLNEGVTGHTLLEWHAMFPGSVVAATYGGKGSARIPQSSSGAVTTLADEVLAQACEVSMAVTTRDELEHLCSTQSGAVVHALERHGLAAYLVAAPKLERKLNTCSHAPGEPECPEGVAIVYAAVDWARCGRTEPIPEESLRRLWLSYLPEGISATDETFAVALGWALRAVAGTIALLQRVGSSCEAFDYVVRLVRDNPAAELPRDASWRAAIDTAEDAQALAVGVAAYNHARLDNAIGAFARAREAAANDVASVAGYNLGVALGMSGRCEEAIAAYDDVIARYGNAPEPALREHVARALVNEGAMLGMLGRFEEAIAAYDDVIARYGNAREPALREQVTIAMVNKGFALETLERFEEAIAAYDDVIARYGNAPEPALREQVAIALLNKGLAFRERFEEAIAAYDEVIARYGNAREPALRESVAIAMVNKGFALGMLERSEEAIAVYDDVIARYGDTREPRLRQAVDLASEGRAELTPE